MTFCAILAAYKEVMVNHFDDLRAVEAEYGWGLSQAVQVFIEGYMACLKTNNNSCKMFRKGFS